MIRHGLHLHLYCSQCMAKLEKAESECKGLMEKYTIVENDKKSLKQVREAAVAVSY